MVPEYHTTIQYEGDTYYVRNLWMSDKPFFLECMADFPSESVERDYSKYFEIIINRKLSHLLHTNKGYFPLDEVESYPNALFLKNNVPFAINHQTMVEGKVIDPTIAIHPDFRNQGLVKIISGYYQYWKSQEKLNFTELEYSVNHDQVQQRQNAKNRGHTYKESRPAIVFGVPNNSPVIHTFSSKITHDYTPGAVYSVTLKEYDITSDKYQTEYVTSGRRDADIAGTSLAWDRGL